MGAKKIRIQKFKRIEKKSFVYIDHLHTMGSRDSQASDSHKKRVSQKPKYSHTYDAAKVVAIGNHPPWFVYLMTHNERSSNFKCYTFIGISSNPFRKHMMHKLKALPYCKKTRPAAAHWVLAEAVGPFEVYAHAKRVKDIWMDITRGENGRHMKGMKIVSVINGYDDGEEDEEDHSDERLMDLKDLAEKKNFTHVVRCFSRTVTEDIPLFLLSRLPPSMCKPSESEPLTLNKVLNYTSSPDCRSSTSIGQSTDGKPVGYTASNGQHHGSNPFVESPFSTPHSETSSNINGKRKRIHKHPNGVHKASRITTSESTPRLTVEAYWGSGLAVATTDSNPRVPMASPFDDNPFETDSVVHTMDRPSKVRYHHKDSGVINIPRSRRLDSMGKAVPVLRRAADGRIIHPSPFEDN